MHKPNTAIKISAAAAIISVILSCSSEKKERCTVISRTGDSVTLLLEDSTVATVNLTGVDTTCRIEKGSPATLFFKSGDNGIEYTAIEADRLYSSAIGRWLRPIGTSSNMKGFELLPGGAINGINFPELTFKSWEIDAEREILVIRSETLSDEKFSINIDNVPMTTRKGETVLTFDGQEYARQ